MLLQKVSQTLMFGIPDRSRTSSGRAGGLALSDDRSSENAYSFIPALTRRALERARCGVGNAGLRSAESAVYLSSKTAGEHGAR